MTQRTYAFDGVPELIAQLVDRGLPWGVVTNKAMRFTGPLTRGMSLFATAAAVVAGDSTPHAKPHPAPLLEAARQLDLPPSRCVYVGDDERDVVAGPGCRDGHRGGPVRLSRQQRRRPAVGGACPHRRPARSAGPLAIGRKA